MKIGLILNNTPSPSEKFLIAKIKVLQQSGHRVIVFANQCSNFNLCKVIQMPKVNRVIIFQLIKMAFSFLILIIKSPIVTIKFLNLEKLDSVTLRRRLENLYLNSKILNRKLDWVHFGFATTTIRKTNVAKSIGAKMGVSIRGYDIFIYPLKNPDCYKNLWNKIDNLHSISKCLLVKAKEYGLNDTVKQTIIYPAVDTSFFRETREARHLNSVTKLQILTVARLHWIKGLEYTLQALAGLKSIDFNYTIVGNGIDYERLILAINQLELNDKVELIGDISHKHIKSYYNKSDIYLQYSIQEGFCNAVLEAQSMGVLVIVSDALGLKENIINNKTGWVVPKRQPILLADKIREVLSMDNKKLYKVRRDAMERIDQNFTLEKQKIEFHKFYHEDFL